MNYKFCLLVVIGTLFLSNGQAKITLSYLQQENFGDVLNGRAKDWVGITLNTKGEGSYFFHKLHMKGRVATQDGDYQISLPQGYISLKGEYGELAIGRKFVNWSAGDSEWGLANVNHHEGLDFIKFKREGLFGIHYTTHRLGFNFAAIASFLYLPQTNPGVNHGDGKVEGKSQWTRVPPKSVIIEGTEIPLYYEVEMPNVSEFLLQHTVGLNLSYKWQLGMPQSRGALAVYGIYKPESNVRVIATSKYEQLGTEQVRVNVSPFVNHQWVYGTKLEQYWKHWYGVVGADIIAPDRKNAGTNFDVGSTEFAPQYVKRHFFHSAIAYRNKNLMIRLSYIKLIKGAGGADDYFSNDTMWYSALGGRLIYKLSDSFRYEGSYRFDFKKRDQLLTSEVQYKATKHISLALGVELMEANNKSSYWYPFRMNDTVYGRFSYSF